MYICPVCFSDIEEGDSCPICHYNLNCRESEESQADIISYRNNWVDEQLAKYPDLSEFEIEGTILKKYTGKSQVVVVPKGIRTISHSAFVRLRGLVQKRVSTVIIPEGITEIEDITFRGSRHIRQVILPNGLISIGERAFDRCSQLRRVVFPKSLRFIGQHAFRGTSIENIHIHENVELIGDGAFHKCEQLNSITISEGNSHFKTYANFLGLYTSNHQLLWYPCNCEELIFPPDVTEIKEDSYYSNIPTTIHIHANVTKVSPQSVIGEKMIFDVDPCNPYYSATTKPPALLSKDGSKLIISGAMNSVSTTSTINKVIPKGIEEICDNANINIPNTIKEIRFADGLRRIGEDAIIIGDYSSIKSIFLPDSVEYIAHNAFPSGGLPDEWTERIDSISISPYTIIEEDSFGLVQEHLRIIRRDSAVLKCPVCQHPNETPTCSVCGFEYSTELDSADKTIRKGKVVQLCQTIRQTALTTEIDLTPYEIECDTLLRYTGSERFVTIPEGIRRIGVEAFKGNTHIEAISFPYGVITIGKSAFAGCENLSYISFSDTIEHLEEYCFRGTNVCRVYLPQALKTYNNPFWGCDHLKELFLPPECTSFKMHRGSLYSKDGSEIFYCSRLTEDYDKKHENSVGTIFNVPETVKTIHGYAFQNVAARELCIGKSAKQIVSSCDFAICIGGSDIEKIIVDPQNKYYSTKDQCPALFSKDGTELLCWPFPKEVSFWEKDKLVAISIPEGVETIHPFSFYGIPGCVEVLHFPDSLRRIQQCAFETYHSPFTMCIKVLYFKPNVELIEDEAFYDFKGIEEIHVSVNTEIRPYAFSPWSDGHFFKY